MSLRQTIIDAIFMATTHYDEPVLDGSDLDFAVLEDSERAADAVLAAIDGYRVVKLEHCQDRAKGYTVNYGAWNVLEELS